MQELLRGLTPTVVHHGEDDAIEVTVLPDVGPHRVDLDQATGASDLLTVLLVADIAAVETEAVVAGAAREGVGRAKGVGKDVAAVDEGGGGVTETGEVGGVDAYGVVVFGGLFGGFFGGFFGGILGEGVHGAVGVTVGGLSD